LKNSALGFAIPVVADERKIPAFEKSIKPAFFAGGRQAEENGINFGHKDGKF